MLHIAILGCAHIHISDVIKIISQRNDIAVKTVWDHQSNRAKQCANTLNAQVASSPNAIWEDPDISAVLILSETDQHFPLVIGSASAKKHLFIEKPLGITAYDTLTMAEAIERENLVFQTGYFLRSAPIQQCLYEHIHHHQSFGKITRIQGHFSHAGGLLGWFDNEWRWMADGLHAGFGAFGDLGTHVLDLLMWYMGDVESATADMTAASDRYQNGDEYGLGILRFKNNCLGLIDASWVDFSSPLGLHVQGTEGTAHVINNQLFIHSRHIPASDPTKPWADLPQALPHPLDQFLDVLLKKHAYPLTTASEAAKRCVVMEALYKAAKSKSWISIA